MSSSRLLGLMAMVLMLLLPMAAKGDDIIDNFLDKVCEEVECGKGSCVVNSSYPLNFLCECDSGWKRTREDDNDTYATSFLPCVIPDCSLNYGCQPAPPPVPEKDIPHNFSAFDPCYWAYCGEGSCTKNRTYTYRCECNPNYFNLLNISVFPCYSECTLGSDCSRLGITVAKSTTDSGSGNSSQASSIFPGRFHWIVMLLMSTGMVMWS
ncbi:uncharacterized protein LOC133284895 isoform X2 [Gastrolobium bilobum]|uniref:uncharacterized protein LOC133284895 isoform X2 n=1 Tax=Gastrolobium bilobum TaxID=150636 RepID=UPI002AAF1FDB|nr:uncharacterized protein LOC133284895 isoform X2 [Gastrolobium bilobum]